MQKRGVDKDRQHRAWLVVLGQRIGKLRADRNFSQVGFAIRAGFARAYYSSIERGERNVSAVNLIRLALALGVEVGELFPLLADFVEEGGSGDDTTEGVLRDAPPEDSQSHLTMGEKSVPLVGSGAAARLLGVNRRTIERWV